MTPDQIKAARAALGLTQAQLARVMGYSGPMKVSDLERGVRLIGSAAERLLRAYVEGYRPKDWPGKIK